jgi:transposase
VDIATNVMQVHWVDAGSGEIMSKPVKRAIFLEYFVNRAPCLIGMESCCGSQHWASWLIEMGRQVKLMPAKFVKAFVTGNKNDSADARAIWMATQVPSEEVAVKTEAQQVVVALHRMRQQLVKFRLMQINCLRGLLTEYEEVQEYQAGCTAAIAESSASRLLGFGRLSQSSTAAAAPCARIVA